MYPPLSRNKITLSMITHNEENRYLFDVLLSLLPTVDTFVILDDFSNDKTVKLIKEIIPKKKLVINQTNENLCVKNESTLRRILGRMTVTTKPDWMLCLDADELFEENYENVLNNLVNTTLFDYYGFRLYDMWDDKFHFREDSHWKAHKLYRIFLYRYYPLYPYTWNNRKLHCGRHPKNIHYFSGKNSQLRIKHLGWMKKEDRIQKYHSYKTLDPQNEYGNFLQYESINDKFPNLIKWKSI